MGAKGTKHDPSGRAPRTVRLSDAGVAEVQRLADHYGCSWGEAARRLMQLGAACAPYRWPPNPWPQPGWGNSDRKKAGSDG